LVLGATIAFCEVDVAELSNGFVASVWFAHSVPHQLSRTHVEVKAHLVIDVAGNGTPRTPGESERSPSSHSRLAQAGSQTRPTAAAYSRHVDETNGLFA